MILSLDLETTALCANRGGIVEIGAQWFCDDGYRMGMFFRECRPLAGCLIEPEALKVNGYTEDRIFDPKRMTEEQAIVEFLGFIRGRMVETREWVKVQIAAWNAHFEMRHLRASLERANIHPAYWGFRHSVIDPYSVLVADLVRGRITVPDTEEGRALTVRLRSGYAGWGSLIKDSDMAAVVLGIEPELKPHNALNGARQVGKVLRALGFPDSEIPVDPKTLHA